MAALNFFVDAADEQFNVAVTVLAVIFEKRHLNDSLGRLVLRPISWFGAGMASAVHYLLDSIMI